MLLLLYALFLASTCANAWTMIFDTLQCSSDTVFEAENGTDVTHIRNNATCPVTGGVKIESCLNPPGGISGHLIQDISNPNISIEVNFSITLPVPDITALFSAFPIRPSSDEEQFDKINLYNGGLSLLMFNNYVPTDPELLESWITPHFFALYAPTLLSHSGYCDAISGTTQLMFFVDEIFAEIMLNMREGAEDPFFSVKAMLIQAVDDVQPVFYVRLQNGGMEGWALSPVNIAFESVFGYGHDLTDTARVEIGCNSQIPEASPGVTIHRVEVSQDVLYQNNV